MAEVLAILGGVAAATQLFSYSLVVPSKTSALSHRIRHASDRINQWEQDSLDMAEILDNVHASVDGLDRVTERLMRNCRTELDQFREKLRPFRNQTQAPRPSRRQEIAFVLRKADEIERQLASFRHAFDKVTLSLIV
jgi:predicted  nucleic acid-binding Zn-ribbon protein